MSYQARTDEVGRIEAPQMEWCKICADRNKATYVVEQNYFTAFFLPVFPTSRKIFKTCPACNARLKVKPNDPNADWINRSIPRRQKLRYWWGLFVYLILVMVLVRFMLVYEFF